MNKAEKIKVEIERRLRTIEPNLPSREEFDKVADRNPGINSDFNIGEKMGAYTMLKKVEQFIDSLEEPVKRTTADIESAMQEVEDKSKAFTAAHPNGFDISFGEADSELMEDTYFIPQGYHAVIDGNKVIIKKGEDPVSNDLDSFAKEYSFNIPSDIYNLLPKEKQSSWIIEIENAVKAGAQWQKQQDQSTIELAEDHAYLAGQEKIIEKACKWLNNFYSEDRHCYFVEEDIDNFKKAMEE